MTTLCTCPTHQDGAPAVIGEHEFALDEDEAVDNENEVFVVWTWLCSCGARGQWQSRSANASYHAWLWHVDRRSA
jgi:hypothetical protein